jgi:hypothetical protein
MIKITGQIMVGEAQGALTAVAARQRGSSLIFTLAVAVLVALGGAGGYAIGSAIEVVPGEKVLDPNVTALVGFGVGLLAYSRLCRGLIVRRFREQMAERDLDLKFQQTFTVTEENLTLESGRVRRVADWAAVTELFKTRDYWIFLVQMEPWFAPSRFFADKAEEKMFIRNALSHLSDKARARSREAAAFASD